jgi:ankyrin repeat protein
MKPMTLLEAIQAGDLAYVRERIGAGANLSEMDENACFTALGHAAYLGRTEIVRALLDAGVLPDENLAYASALAAAALGGKIEAACILVDAGATLDSADETGMTPLIHAARGGHIVVVRYLVEAGANLHHRDFSSRYAPRKNALDYSVDEGFPEIAVYLLERGARFEPEDYMDGSGAVPKNASDIIELARRTWAAKHSGDD